MQGWTPLHVASRYTTTHTHTTPHTPPPARFHLLLLSDPLSQVGPSRLRPFSAQGAQTCFGSLGPSLFSCRLKPFFGLLLTASLQHGASVDSRAKYSTTPLHHCCENSHPQVIPLLLDASANINAREKNHGRMPVHLAARSGCVDSVIQLALARADLNAPDAYSRTALHEACWAACTSHIAVRSPPLV